MSEQERDRLHPGRMRSALAWRTAYLAVQGGLSLIVFGALGHVLPAASFAVTATAQGAVVIAWSVGDLGLAQAAVSVLPERLARTSAPAAVIAGAARAFLIASLAAVLLCCAAALAVPASARLSLVLIAPAAGVTVMVSGADGILRAQGDFGRPLRLVLASRAGAFAALIGAAASSRPEWTCACMSLGMALASLQSIGLIQSLARRSQAGEARRFLIDSIPLGASQLLVVATGRVNTLILVSTSGVRSGALFETAWRIYQLGQYVIGALATGWAPFFAASLGRGQREQLRHILRRSMLVTLLAGIAVGAGLVIAGPALGRLLARGVASGTGGVLEPLAIATPLTFLGVLVTFVVSASPRHRRLLLPVSGAGALVNIVLALILCPGHGADGAALASAAGLAVSSLLLLAVTAEVISGAERPAGEIAPTILGAHVDDG